MKKMSEIKVTQFDTVKSKSHRQILLFEELRNIKTGLYKDLVIECRKALLENNKELYNLLKSKLPVVTFCGEFENGHRASDLMVYNNLMIIDIDSVYDNIDELKKRLGVDKYILSLWISPSGNGLKGIIKTGNVIEHHKAAFSSLREYFFERYAIELDKSGSDVCRLCYCSWDENIIYNPNSELYTEILSDQKVAITDKKRKELNIALTKNAYATEGLNNSNDRYLMKKIISYLYKKDISITINHNNWIKVALAISYSFSYDVGEKYFLQLCRLDKDKHDENASINLLKYCYNKRQLNTLNTVSFGTVIFMAKEKGFKIL